MLPSGFTYRVRLSFYLMASLLVPGGVPFGAVDNRVLVQHDDEQPRLIRD